MARIIDHINLSGNISKIVELPNEFIINGSVYDKNNLIPKPLNFLPILSENNNIVFNKTLYNNIVVSTLYSNKSEQCMVQDNRDFNISYLMCKIDSASNNKLYKIINNGIKYEITSLDIALGSSPTWNIIDQNENYLYIAGLVSNTTGLYMYVYDKKLHLLSGTLSFNGFGEFKIIHKNNSYIYLITKTATKIMRVYRFNKSNNSLTILYDVTTTGKILMQGFNEIDDLNNIYASISSEDIYPGTNYLMLRRFNIDFSLESITTTNIELDCSILGDKINIFNDNNLSYTTNMYDLEDDGKRYLVIAISSLKNPIPLPSEYCGIYVFEIVSEDDIKLVNYTKDINISPQGAITIDNNKTILLMGNNCVDFYKFNTLNKKYEKVSRYDNNIDCVGIDINENIYIQNKDTSVEVITPVSGINCSVSFDKSNYTYLNQDIPANIEVSVYNYLGNYISANVELKLIGNVVFGDGSNIKTVTTSNTNKMIIPVVIKGNGLIRVIPKIL